MKIAIIGANGNVGTELSYLLKNECEIIPIVRNRVGGAFLEHQGIKCRIGDIANSESAKKILSDIDVVINSTWISDRFSGSQNQTSRLIGKNIIENCFKYTKQDAKIIYLSTVRAFSNKVDPTTSKYWQPRYDVEKRFLEKVMKKNLKKYKKKGIVFRCGHVFGEGQPNTKEIRKQLSKKEKLIIEANPNDASNILHIITLKDAIFKCLDKKIKSNTYSLVNNPQWTWKEIYEFYNQSAELEFVPPTIKTKINLNQIIFKILKGKRKYLIPILYHFPRKFESRVIKELSIRKYKSEINKLELKNKISSGNFVYFEIPGIKLPNLLNTREELKKYDSSIFKIK